MNQFVAGKLLAPLPLVLIAVGAGLLWPSEALADRTTPAVYGVLMLTCATVATTMPRRSVRD